MMFGRFFLLAVVWLGMSGSSLLPPDGETANFLPPLNVPLYLAGTFGELRGSHFHSGIDIKTQGKEGLEVRSAAEGYVSRIKISASGFGKAIYIDHPNGYTTVYAHLQRFNPQIEEYIRQIQHMHRSFEVDKYLQPGDMKISAGELIAWSGNTGGSSAPHLHFEVRDKVTQKPLNPLAFNFSISDIESPRLEKLLVYAMANAKEIALPLEYIPGKKATGSYSLSKDTLSFNSASIALGIDCYDLISGSSNRNGVYEILLKADDRAVYRFKMDGFFFNETRYIQAHIDYRCYVEKDFQAHRCFVLPGDEFSVYDSLANRGIIQLNEKPKKLSLSVKDYKGNTSLLEFYAKYEPAAKAFSYSNTPYDTLFDYRSSNVYKTPDVEVFFPVKTFYEPVRFHYGRSPGEAAYMYSDVHHIHYSYEPAHTYFTVSIKASKIPLELKSKAVVVWENAEKEWEAKRSYWTGPFLTAKTRDLGDYFVTIDTLAPEIKPISNYNNAILDNNASMRISIMDTLSGISEYIPQVDGYWALMEYDEKNDMLTYTPAPSLPSGEHELVLTVRDNIGNESIYKTKFRRP